MTLEELKPFCGSRREAYMEPFTDGEYTFATNGHIIVRVPKLSEITAEAQFDMNRIKFDHDQITNWREVPQGNVEKKLCEDCKGAGRVHGCKECGGNGELEFETDYSTYYCSCDSCSGLGVCNPSGGAAGSMLCDRCNGTGYDKKGTPIDVGRPGGYCISSIYLEKIAALPGAMYSPFGEEGDMFRFRFDGGLGAVMPMRT